MDIPNSVWRHVGEVPAGHRDALGIQAAPANSDMLADMHSVPLLIEFIAGTRLFREAAFSTGLPIVGNGPPGTFVLFLDGRTVPLPTDQVVESDDESGAARVGFGGMAFMGQQSRQLVFHRVKDLWPPAQLSPERGLRMTLETSMVAVVLADGAQVWPEPERMN